MIQDVIYFHLKENREKEFSTDEVADELDMSVTSARRSLRKLYQSGFIERRWKQLNSGRGGRRLVYWLN